MVYVVIMVGEEPSKMQHHSVTGQRLFGCGNKKLFHLWDIFLLYIDGVVKTFHLLCCCEFSSFYELVNEKYLLFK